MLTLMGRTCVFSGASGGDGTASVKALCKGGMNVVMLTHQLQQARELIEEIDRAGYPGKCSAVLDGNAQTPPVSDERVFADIEKEFGSIDVIISNTGTDGFEDSIDSVSRESLLRDVEHLLGGSYSMLKCALPYLRKSKGARVIFMTTVEGVRGGNRESFSNAVAKSAVLGLAKNCAARLAEEGITVNCIEKGAVQRITKEKAKDGRAPKEAGDWVSMVPVGRLGTPEDLASAICFLVSEEASYITGAVLEVDGGLHLV